MSHEITRRQALGALGAGAALVVLGCGDDASNTGTTGASSPAATATAGTTTTAQCVLMPELTEGPYYLPDSMLRSRITEGRPGTALELQLTVQDASESCAPIEGATVEIWHADASGEYSGVGDGGQTTFLRGGQKSGADGSVTFQTIFPGWYQGRTAHIHIKVFPGEGDQVHTGQLFFDDSVYERIYTQGEYAARGGADTTNANDGIYGQSGGDSTLTLTKNGDGYTGQLALGIQS